MTTSISNAATEALAQEDSTAAARGTTPKTATRVRVVHTLASSFIFFILGAAIVLSTLAYGTVHYWSLAVFQLGAALIIAFWAVDAWRTRLLRFSRNSLQWPLIGLCLLGLLQLLPFGSAAGDAGALLSNSAEPVKSLSMDPYATRLVLVRVLSLLVYFAAALAFTDSPRRLRLLVRTITIFGFALAVFGLIQSFTSPTKVYWLRELQQSTPFGPFINRHHFAGYMELTLALPLGLLFCGAIEKDKRVLYIFAAALMGVALIMTGSRGGIISLGAEVLFLAALTGLGFRRKKSRERHGSGEERVRLSKKGLLLRAGLALGLVLALMLGTVMLGGEAALSRFFGTVNAEDPTTGRAHFWSVTLDIIKHHPVLGTGLGAFGVVYTRYDSRNGMYRLEQAHNDYLQLVSDGGVLGLALGLLFVIALFRMGLARCQSEDTFRRGVATGALAGCFAVLVHSFFDFTLHTTANALLFLTVAALATLDGRIEQAGQGGHRRRRRRRRSSSSQDSIEQRAATAPNVAAP